MNKDIFKNLFVLDMANNHQGDLKHASNIINAHSKIVNEEKINGCIKFQYRNLKTFIHPNEKRKKSNKHTSRFLSTKMSEDNLKKMADLVKINGLLTMTTPFDEESLELIEKFNIDIVKIASCSATDWPLLKTASKLDKPFLISTGGLTFQEIDQIYNFFKKQKKVFALNHCVAIYPTPDKDLNLNIIEKFVSRYNDIMIGWSTHEDQNNVYPVSIAYSKGARIFERHIGINTNNKYKLNKYSSTPQQLKKWLISFKKTVKMCGADEKYPSSQLEKDSLNSLKRGVFLKKNKQKGSRLNRNDIYFAFPKVSNGIDTSEFRDGAKIKKSIKKDGPILKDDLLIKKSQNLADTYKVQIQSFLRSNNIVLNDDTELEISHHYGLNRFREFGAGLISIVNREEYCKKIVIQLPRQKHPYHLHKRKTETFHIFSGDLQIVKNGKVFELKTGDIFHVEANEWHKFSTHNGVIFEEVSTQHFNNDSFYEDPVISSKKREERKTIVKLNA